MILQNCILKFIYWRFWNMKIVLSSIILGLIILIYMITELVTFGNLRQFVLLILSPFPYTIWKYSSHQWKSLPKKNFPGFFLKKCMDGPWSTKLGGPFFHFSQKVGSLGPWAGPGPHGLNGLWFLCGPLDSDFWTHHQNRVSIDHDGPIKSPIINTYPPRGVLFSLK